MIIKLFFWECSFCLKFWVIVSIINLNLSFSLPSNTANIFFFPHFFVKILLNLNLPKPL